MVLVSSAPISTSELHENLSTVSTTDMHRKLYLHPPGLYHILFFGITFFFSSDDRCKYILYSWSGSGSKNPTIFSINNVVGTYPWIEWAWNSPDWIVSTTALEIFDSLLKSKKVQACVHKNFRGEGNYDCQSARNTQAANLKFYYWRRKRKGKKA